MIDLSALQWGQWLLRALEGIVVSRPAPPAEQLAVDSDELQGRPPVGAGERPCHLVTHFMEEAQHLCDRVVVMRDGLIVADDTPDRLAARVGGARTMSFRPSKPLDIAALVALPGVSDAHAQGDGVSVTGTSDFTAEVISFLAGQGATAHNLRIDAPNLDDAYFTLTGDGEPGTGAMNPEGDPA